MTSETHHLLLGRAFAMARVRKGWNQEQAAAPAGLSLDRLSSIERDYRSPRWDEISRLCEALGIKVEWLISTARDVAAQGADQ